MNASSRIGILEVQQDCSDDDGLPLVGELDGIGQEVQEYLHVSQLVTHQVFKYITTVLVRYIMLIELALGILDPHLEVLDYPYLLL